MQKERLQHGGWKIGDYFTRRRRRCENQGTATDLAITEKSETRAEIFCVLITPGWSGREGGERVGYYLSAAHLCFWRNLLKKRPGLRSCRHAKGKLRGPKPFTWPPGEIIIWRIARMSGVPPSCLLCKDEIFQMDVDRHKRFCGNCLRKGLCSLLTHPCSPLHAELNSGAFQARSLFPFSPPLFWPLAPTWKKVNGPELIST